MPMKGYLLRRRGREGEANACLRKNEEKRHGVDLQLTIDRQPGRKITLTTRLMLFRPILMNPYVNKMVIVIARR